MSTISQSEPKFPPDIVFFKANFLVALPKCYVIDSETAQDILAAMHCKTASQAYRRAKLLEVLEQNTSSDRGAEKEVKL
jgi:hypothetical protein